MNKFIAATLLTASGALFLAGAAHATTLTKSPDLGTYWGQLSSKGSYVYADSFIAPVTGTVTDLGMWLKGGSSSLVFEILADSSNSPNGASVLATTAAMSFNLGALTFEHAAPTSSATLIAGQEYWFAGSTVGLAGSGGYSTGGHTQNSEGISDNGTFWFSNDAMGVSFDGKKFTPEMAFSVSINEVPEPTSMALLGAGVVFLGAMRRKAA